MKAILPKAKALEKSFSKSPMKRPKLRWSIIQTPNQTMVQTGSWSCKSPFGFPHRKSKQAMSPLCLDTSTVVLDLYFTWAHKHLPGHPTVRKGLKPIHRHARSVALTNFIHYLPAPNSISISPELHISFS